MNAISEIKPAPGTKTLTVDLGELRQALAFTHRALQRHYTIPILGQHLFNIRGGKLELHATDLDRHAIQRIDCAARGKWAFITDGRRLMKLISGMQGSASFTLNTKSQRLTFQASGITLTTGLMYPPEDWPALKTPGPAIGTIKIGEATLHEALRLTAPCISTEETRYYLNGVFWTEHNGKSRMVTTDGHRLARCDLDAPAPPKSMIVPHTAIPVINAMITRGGDGEVKVTRHNSLVITVEHGNRTLHTKLIDGTYPDYKRVIPEPSDTVDVVISHQTTKRLTSIMSGWSQSCCISPAKASISVQLTDEKGELSIPIATQAKGGPDVAFNTLYLHALTKAAGDLRLRSKAPGDPARLTNQDTPNLLYILMPTRV